MTDNGTAPFQSPWKVSRCRFCFGDIVASSAQADLSAVLDTAANGFIADMNGTPAPAETAQPQTSAPVAPPAVPPQTATPEPPAAPTPDVPVATSPTVDTSTLGDEAKRYLEMHGGDANKALAKALADNNRLAQLSREGRSTQPTQTPTAQPQTPEPPAPPVDYGQEIEQSVKAYVHQDPECLRLDGLYRQNEARIKEIGSALDNTQNALLRNQIRADLDEIKSDPLRADDIAREIARLDSQRVQLRHEKLILEQENRQHVNDWKSREGNARSYFSSQAQQRQQEYSARVEYEQRVADAATALEAAWQPAMLRAMEKHKIPPAELQEFNEECQNVALANNERGLTVTDVDEFFDKQGTKFSGRMDRFHRLKSAEYAQQTEQRTALTQTPGPVVVAPAETNTLSNLSLDEILERTRGLVRQDRGR